MKSTFLATSFLTPATSFLELQADLLFRVECADQPVCHFLLVERLGLAGSRWLGWAIYWDTAREPVSKHLSFAPPFQPSPTPDKPRQHAPHPKVVYDCHWLRMQLGGHSGWCTLAGVDVLMLPRPQAQCDCVPSVARLPTLQLLHEHSVVLSTPPVPESCGKCLTNI